MTRQLHFLLLLRPGGYYRSGWRVPGSPAERTGHLGIYVELAQAAERAKFDGLFMADSLALYGDPWDHLSQPLEPLTLLSAIAAVTERIGLIATCSTTYSEPYNLARQLATLDRISEGRSGVNIVTTADPKASRNFGSPEHLEHRRRYERAGEFVDVLRELWDSWADDSEAIVVDREAGVATSPGTIRPIDHHGEWFDVAGPLNVPRPIQGYPVLASAGQSPDSLAVTPAFSELLFGVQHDLGSARAGYDDFRARVVAADRQSDDVKVLPGLLPIIGGTEAEARGIEANLQELNGPDAFISELSWYLKTDLTALSPSDVIRAEDVPHPDTVSAQSWYRQLHAELEGNPATVTELVERYSHVGRSGHLQVVGTPEQVADEIQRWFEAPAVDGFVIQPTTVPGSLDAFLNEVVPILQNRGLYRREYEGSTLRDHLGLTRPARAPAKSPASAVTES